MANTGLEVGIKVSGKNTGVKSGLSLSQMRGGMLSGSANGTMVRKIMQNPALLTGVKAPIFYWNAESCTVNASNIVLSVTNLAPGSVETFSILSPSTSNDPLRVPGAVKNGKAAIFFDSGDNISTSLAMSGKSEATFFLVAKADGGSGTVLFSFRWNAPNDTAGDFSLTSQTGEVRADLFGNPTSTKSTYDSYQISNSEFYIFVLKIRLAGKNGSGSEQELYINGVRQKVPVATTYTAATSFLDSPIYFGGNLSQVSGGNTIASGLVFDYALGDAERVRIENYFRWYYGLA